MATTVQRPASMTEDVGLPLILRLRPVLDLSDDQLLALCAINQELWIERNAQGELLIMPPASGGSGKRNAEITCQVTSWAKGDGTGTAFDSSTGFRLANGAMRAPDAAWVLNARLATLPSDAWDQFLPLCPDFVVELRSPSDRLRDLQAKMDEWIANGARLGWLVDPKPRHLYIYRLGVPAERLDAPDTVAGDPVLPGFVLDLRPIW